jgi:maltose O-acetyltransferase
MTDTERAKMLRGELYRASDPVLVGARQRARLLWMRFNASSPEHDAERVAILMDLLGKVAPGAWIEPPFHCDYGTQIELEEDVFINMGCVFLDPAPIRIGAQTQLGPCVQLYTADHPREAAQRVSGPELAKPITIGSRVWIGGGTIVLPGVTIGEDTTIGAGSVVVRDIPSGVVAAGNPCRVIRSL